MEDFHRDKELRFHNSTEERVRITNERLISIVFVYTSYYINSR